MRISTRLILAALIPGLMAAVAIGGVVRTYDPILDLQRQQAAVIQLRRDLNQLEGFARSYVVRHDERSRTQFLAKHDELSGAIAEAASSGDRRYGRDLETIAEDVRVAGSLFSRVVSTLEDEGASEPLSGEAVDLLSTRLFIRTQEANGRIGDLVGSISDDIVTTQRRSSLTITTFMVLAAAALTGGLILLRRNITVSLRALEAGTDAIGEGHLDYRIALPVSDELGELGSSFDLMSERLQGTIVSRDELEAEVAKRQRAEEEAKRELVTTTLLLEAADALAKVTVLDDVLEVFADRLLRTVDHKRVVITLWDAVRREYSVAASAGETPVPVGLITAFEEVTAPAREMVGEPRTKVVDYEAMPEGERGRSVEMSTRRLLAVPIVFRGRFLGIASLDDPGGRQEFTDREIKLVEGLAAQVGAAIENARLYEAEREAALLGRALADIDNAIHSSLESSDVLGHALELGANALNADSAALSVREERTFRVLHTYGFSPDISGTVMPDDLEQHSLQAMETQEPVAVEDAGTDTRVVAEHMAHYGVGAVLVVPLVVGGEGLGTVYYNFSEPHRFSSAEIEFGSRVAASLSLALENARLYEAEHRIADRLQEALLTLPDRIGGIEFAHAYHGATEAARVGGDFYDVFELNHHHVGITIGDVAGKGLDAAVLTSLVKNTIRAHANEKGKTPAQILTLTNDVVYKSTTTESFVTVFFAVLDCRDGRLVYSNAGHTTAALVKEDGTVAQLPVTGPIVGAFFGATFSQSEASIGMDELLFLYTDGLTEARSNGDLYGEDCLFAILSESRDGSTRDVVHAVITDVMAFSGNRLNDDLAILSVRRLEPGAETPMQQKLEM